MMPSRPSQRLLSEGLQGLRGDAKQQVVDQQPVVADQRQQRLGQREDDVEVLDRQQLQGALIDPGTALAGAAFRAVAVAAGVVAVLLVAAVVAFVDMATQFLGPALGDGRQGLVLLQCQLVPGAVGGTVFPEDVADLERWVGRVWREGSSAGLDVRSTTVHKNSINAGGPCCLNHQKFVRLESQLQN